MGLKEQNMICGAKTRSGTQCQKSPLENKRRCRLHGGASLSGTAHPNYKHGNCTNSIREKNRLTREEIGVLIQMAEMLGLFPPKRRPKRI